MRRLIVVVTSLLLAVMILAACQAPATPSPTPTAVPSPKPVVTTPPPAKETPKSTSAATQPPVATSSPVTTTVPKPLPKAISLTTWPAGTTSYVAGLAIGGVLQKYADIKVAVEPLASPLPGYSRMAKGEVELVTSSAPFMYGTYTGTVNMPKNDQVRDIFFLYATNYSIITRADTGIKKVEDLKGRKVSAIYPAVPGVELLFRSLFKLYGMDFDKDITAVRHSTILEMYENLKERRVDATFGTVLRINMEEQDRSPGGAYIVPIPRDKIVAAQKEWPFYFPDIFPAGFPGAKQDTLSFFCGLGLNSGANISDDLIYTATKVALQHVDEIKPSHAELVDFSESNFAKYPSIPFHNGAIKYYKERGFWTKELDDFQKRILAEGK